MESDGFVCLNEHRELMIKGERKHATVLNYKTNKRSQLVSRRWLISKIKITKQRSSGPLIMATIIFLLLAIFLIDNQSLYYY